MPARPWTLGSGARRGTPRGGEPRGVLLGRAFRGTLRAAVAAEARPGAGWPSSSGCNLSSVLGQPKAGEAPCPSAIAFLPRGTHTCTGLPAPEMYCASDLCQVTCFLSLSFPLCEAETSAAASEDYRTPRKQNPSPGWPRGLSSPQAMSSAPQLSPFNWRGPALSQQRMPRQLFSQHF